MRDIALPGIRHAQRPVNKKFDSGIGRLMNGLNLLKTQLTRQHDLREPHVSEKFGFLHAADIALGAGMEFDGRDVQLQNAHVLDDQRVNAVLPEIGNQSLCGFQFIVVKNRVQRDKDFCAIAMGERHQLGDIFQAIAGIMTRPKAGTTDIDGVRTV